MSEEMWTTLEAGPVPAAKESNLTKAIETVESELGGFSEDPQYHRANGQVTVSVAIGTLNYGAGQVGGSPGSLHNLIDAQIPYRIWDDGGRYYEGSEYLWYPSLHGDPFYRQHREGIPVIDSDTVEVLRKNHMDSVALELIAGLLSTDLSNPALADAVQVLRDPEHSLMEVSART